MKPVSMGVSLGMGLLIIVGTGVLAQPPATRSSAVTLTFGDFPPGGSSPFLNLQRSTPTTSGSATTSKTAMQTPSRNAGTIDDPESIRSSPPDITPYVSQNPLESATTLGSTNNDDIFIIAH